MSQTSSEKEAANRIEQDLLAYSYVDGTTLDRAVQAGVTPSHFVNPFHHHQFAFLCELRLAGKGTDTVSVYQEAIARGVLEKLGGLSCITGCSDMLQATCGGSDPAIRALCALYAKRESLKRLHQTVNGLETGTLTLDDTGTVLDEVKELCAGKQRDRARTMAEIDADINADLLAQEEGKATEGEITWGLPKLDKYMKPIKRNEYVLVCARPSRGKTSMLTHLCLANLRKGKRVVYFNLEDADTQIVMKMAAQSAGVCVGEWANLMPSDRKRYMDAKAAMVKTGRLLVFDRDMTIEAIQTRSRMLAQSFKPDLVVIDYLGCLRVPGKSLYESVSAMSKSMVPLRKMLGCALVVGQQLKRLETDEKEPGLSDLRDSGQLEEDAVRVAMLHWKDSRYLDQETRPYKVLQPKYRFGPTTAVDGITFHAPTTRWMETSLN